MVFAGAMRLASHVLHAPDNGRRDTSGQDHLTGRERFRIWECGIQNEDPLLHSKFRIPNSEFRNRFPPVQMTCPSATSLLVHDAP